MADVVLTFVWHQHQPYYPNDVTGENPMPWVRLHGVKDYYGMAMHLREFPEMRCTINLVPSLLVQLRAYVEKNAGDRFLDLSRVPADSLTAADCLFLLDHFFMANPGQMIEPYPRYRELHHLRGFGKNDANEALRRFHERDLRDLQVWFNLTWIHPIAVEQDAFLRELHAKGQNFTEEEKLELLEKHRQLLARVIPLHKELALSGQVELTTTPFYHPILPLLLDKKLAREAIPEVALPRASMGYPEDAAVHVQRAMDYHAEVFGSPPQGMWPAEGSVCQSMIPLLARSGVRWIATDEGILNASTQGHVSRDTRGHVRHPELMYRTYRAREGDAELGIVFRDHLLSDLIGFNYQHSGAEVAADHFIGWLQGIAQAVPHDQTAVVPVILDGENCWEHYLGGGVPFLRALYERCVRNPHIHPMTVRDCLQRHPPSETLPHLFAGSWINHNFAIWIGHEEDNTAWEALHRTREFLVRRERELGGELAEETRESLERAWEEVYIAEGSDWFWWYGEDHSSAQDALFDSLFRTHLQNVYLLLGETPPAELARPIKRTVSQARYTQPRSFLQVQIDGRYTFFEWFGAGRYECQNERGTMAQASKGPLKELHFGFSLDDLLLRVDCDESAQVSLWAYDFLRIGFADPPGYEVRIHHPGRADQQTELVSPEGAPEYPRVSVAVDLVVEAAIPFDWLGARVEQPIQFVVELFQEGQIRDRAPREGTITLARPSPDYERMMWDV
jgi:alpha-amylase/alpha-mannosidase (GH57 family)